MDLQLYAPSTLRHIVVSVPALDITLSPEVPETRVTTFAAIPTLDITLSAEAPTSLRSLVTGVPSVDVTVTPDTPTTLRSLISAIPALDITLSPEAPTTTVTAVGTTTTTVPTLDITLSAEAITTLRSLVTVVPAEDITLSPLAPTVTSDAEVAAEEGPPPGGGRGYGSKYRQRGKYPRRVMIDGVLYWVRSAEEERMLLESHLAKVEAEAIDLVSQDAPKQEIAKARVKVVRAANRIEKVDDREADWIAYLHEEDEEILMAVMH